jgi:hypothetical protein
MAAETLDVSPVPWLTREEYEATVERALDGDAAALHALFFQPVD